MRKPFFWVCALVCSTFVVGCNVDPELNESPKSAMIVRWSNGAASDVISVDDVATVREFESFFPGYKERPKSSVNLLLDPDSSYSVFFRFSHGLCICLDVTENMPLEKVGYWSVGKGDHKIRGDFDAFFERLRKVRAAEQAAEKPNDNTDE